MTTSNVPTEIFAYGSHTKSIINQAVAGSFAPFSSDLPGNAPWSIKYARRGNLILLTWAELGASFVNVTGTMPEDEVNFLINAAGSHRRYHDLKGNALIAPYFGLRRLLLLLEIVDDQIDVDSWSSDVVAWLADKPWSVAQDHNRQRVKYAVPQPPTWDVETIANSCWVVESEEGCSQGTAFAIDGGRFVTCHHVLHGPDGEPFSDLVIFQPNKPSERYEIDDVRSNKILDIAMFRSSVAPEYILKLSQDKEFRVMSHVAVCGFPNFRPGQTCSISPGLVVAIRPSKGGIRRLLTNAGIVAGMSGGPAVSHENTVIGVCANGAAYMQDVRDTEDQAIVPITTLDLIG
ncbi:hypothetical protein CJD35_11340 [Sphingobium xenophagum]|uniref:Serine protease n=1 Tax=Sphingobium xenophagum TaxID=121428 RepID=A0A249MUH1_SPHXE|nr:serine protease [Sphingobium xenophagum]ASY44968.1 hypothetical protein CJD35_11340 [Sphingobium xenophagum]